MQSLKGRGDRLLAIVSMLAVAILVLSAGARALHPAKAYGGSDLLAFYCAGQVENLDLDPYAADPIMACERQTQDAIGTPPELVFSGVDPAPLPATTLLPFRALAGMPYLDAARLFTVFVFLACAIAVWGLSRAIALPWWGIATVIALGDFETNAVLGQLAPFCLAVFVLSGLALAKHRPIFAGAIAPLALVQPNAGLPILAALVLWVPRARVPAVAGAALFALVGLACGGPHLTAEYVSAVVPAQALAEVSSRNQLSLTWLAWLLGASDIAAVRIGEAGYAVIAGLAVLFARRAARALRSDAAIVWLPAASVVAFGVYVHGNQLCYAAPLALLLATSAPPRVRAAAWAGLLLVTLPFYGDTKVAQFLEVVTIAVATRFAFAELPIARRVAIGAITTALVAAVTLGIPHLPKVDFRPAGDAASYAAERPHLELASGRLGLDVRATFTASTPQELALRLPAWFGLVALIAMSAVILRAKGNQSLAEGG